MSPWHTFLETQGAQIAPDGASHFPSQPACDAHLCDLGDTALISISGPDAIKFLQGQVTCDLRELNAERWLKGAQCNLKGRVIVSFAVAQLNEHTLLLRLAKDLRQPLLDGLAKYAVFSKVELAAAPQWQALGLCGTGIEALIKSLNPAPASNCAAGNLQALAGGLVLHHGDNRAELWLEQDNAVNIWLKLAAQAAPASTQRWWLAQITAGSAEVVAATSEQFTPQDLDYPAQGAVSFKKGCYTGQEVVARLHYKGKLKKHLYPIEFTADSAPAAGTELCNQAGKNLGQLVQAAPVQDTLYRGLAVLPDDDSEALFIGGQGSKALRLKLPYDINDTNTID